MHLLAMANHLIASYVATIIAGRTQMLQDVIPTLVSVTYTLFSCQSMDKTL